MAEYLFRFVEGAPVVVYRTSPGLAAEVVPTRRDLFDYVGGIGWGYNGSGAQNLSYAIVGKLFEDDGLAKSELQRRALKLLDAIISRLDNEKEHDLKEEDLIRWAS